VLESERATAYYSAAFQKNSADMVGCFDFDPVTKYIELVKSILMRFHGGIEQLRVLDVISTLTKNS
jgi:hypothetical protein